MMDYPKIYWEVESLIANSCIPIGALYNYVADCSCISSTNIGIAVYHQPILEVSLQLYNHQPIGLLNTLPLIQPLLTSRAWRGALRRRTSFFSSPSPAPPGYDQVTSAARQPWKSDTKTHGGFPSHRGTPRNIIHFRSGFSLMNHPAIGYPHDYGNPHIDINQNFLWINDHHPI